MSAQLSNELSRLTYYRMKVANNPRLKAALEDVLADIKMDIVAENALGEVSSEYVATKLQEAYSKIDTFI